MNGIDPIDTLATGDGETPTAWSMPTADFRTRQYRFALSPTERATVDRRPRFYTMPWLRRADQPDTDQIP